MDDLQLLTALLLYVLVIALAVAWFLLPRWLYGPKALLAEKVRLERDRRAGNAAHSRHAWRRTRLFPGSSSH